MSLKVLICDADDRFVDRATDFLSRHGHQVLTEPLAEEVYGVVKSWRPDVLVLASEAVYPDGGVVLSRYDGGYTRVLRIPWEAAGSVTVTVKGQVLEPIPVGRGGPWHLPRSR